MKTGNEVHLSFNSGWIESIYVSGYWRNLLTGPCCIFSLSYQYAEDDQKLLVLSKTAFSLGLDGNISKSAFKLGRI